MCGRHCNVQSVYNITDYNYYRRFNIKFYSLTEMCMHVQSCSQINFMVGYVEHIHVHVHVHIHVDSCSLACKCLV